MARQRGSRRPRGIELPPRSSFDSDLVLRSPLEISAAWRWSWRLGAAGGELGESATACWRLDGELGSGRLGLEVWNGVEKRERSGRIGLSLYEQTLRTGGIISDRIFGLEGLTFN